MSKSKSISPEPMRCDNCERVLIDLVYLDEKGNLAIDTHGRREDIHHDDKNDERYVICPECGNRQIIHLRLPV